MSVKQRLIEFLKFKKIGQRKFSQIVGLSYGYVNAIRVSIQPDTLHKIAIHFPELNLAWLITGEGQMIKEDATSSRDIPAIPGVPYYNLDIYNDIQDCFNGIIKPEYYINNLPFNDCTAYLTIYGNSMEPFLKNGELIAIKRVANHDILLWGEPYFIITNDKANNLKTVKLLFQHTDLSKVILRSSNPEFPGDTIVLKDDIVSLFSVKGKISRYLI